VFFFRATSTCRLVKDASLSIAAVCRDSISARKRNANASLLSKKWKGADSDAAGSGIRFWKIDLLLDDFLTEIEQIS